MTRPVQHTASAVAGWLRDGRRVAAGLLVVCAAVIGAFLPAVRPVDADREPVDQA